MAFAISTCVSASKTSQLAGRQKRSAGARYPVRVLRSAPAAVGASPASRYVAGRPITRCPASESDEQPSSGKAADTEMDFDAYLALFAEKYEASENKAAVAGYSIGAIVAFIFVEYFIHLPVFNVLLGFPLQLLGVFMAPYLGVRYLMDGKDVKEDIGTAVTSVTDKLPGLK